MKPNHARRQVDARLLPRRKCPACPRRPLRRAFPSPACGLDRRRPSGVKKRRHCRQNPEAPLRAWTTPARGRSRRLHREALGLVLGIGLGERAGTPDRCVGAVRPWPSIWSSWSSSGRFCHKSCASRKASDIVRAAARSRRTARRAAFSPSPAVPLAAPAACAGCSTSRRHPRPSSSACSRWWSSARALRRLRAHALEDREESAPAASPTEQETTAGERGRRNALTARPQLRVASAQAQISPPALPWGPSLRAGSPSSGWRCRAAPLQRSSPP